jgi:hypothetical protein
MKSTALKTRIVETLRDEIEQVQHRITERAYETPIALPKQVRAVDVTAA